MGKMPVTLVMCVNFTKHGIHLNILYRMNRTILMTSKPKLTVNPSRHRNHPGLSVYNYQICDMI